MYAVQISTDGSVDLSGVAAATEGFSGADLQAIASEAQLTAVMAFLESAKAKETEAGAGGRSQLEPPKVAQQVLPRAPARRILVNRTVHMLCGVRLPHEIGVARGHDHPSAGSE